MCMRTLSASRITLASLVALACSASAGCMNDPAEGESRSEGSALQSASDPAANADDVYKTIYDSIQDADVIRLLKDMSGVNPVTVGSETFSITDRFNAVSK